jgi:hypothetical protein
MERFQIFRNLTGFSNNVQVSAAYTVPYSLLSKFNSHGIALQSLIYATLREIIMQHPIMGVVVQDESSLIPNWKRLETIDLRQLVKFVSGDPNTSFDEWVQVAHRKPLDRCEELALWRVVVVSKDGLENLTAEESEDGHVQFAIGFFYHHGIADGLSGGAFHLTFLDILKEFITDNTKFSFNTTEPALVSIPKLPLVPSLEEEGNLSVSVFFALKQIIKAFVFNPKDNLLWAGPIATPELPRPPICNNRSFLLSPSSAKKLVAKCREEKTTITSLLNVLIVRKLAIMYPSHTHFRANIPFSFRQFTKRTPRDMGNFVSNIEPYFSTATKPESGYISCRSPSDFQVASPESDQQLWDSTRACRKAIVEGSSSPRNQLVGLVKFIDDIPKFFVDQLTKPRPHAYEITNIGVFDGALGEDGEGVAGRASFNRMKFSASLTTCGDPYVFSLATVKNGYMDVTINWETGVVSDDEALELLGWIEGEFKRIASS